MQDIAVLESAFACIVILPAKLALASLLIINTLNRKFDRNPHAFTFPDMPAVNAGLITVAFCYTANIPIKLA